MPSLKSIRKRVTSVKNTRKITKAMKMVSAAKLRRATERAQSSRPYEKELLDVVANILREVEWNSPLVEKRDARRILMAIISPDKGLCGSLNSNLLKAAGRFLEENSGSSIEVIALGKKARAFATKRGLKIRDAQIDLLRRGNYDLFRSIAGQLRSSFVAGDFDRVVVFYTEFKSPLLQVSNHFDLLPFAAPKLESQTKAANYIYEPAGKDLLDRLVPLLVDFRLYRAALESFASEHGARMTAMDAASNNCRDMISRLTLEMNRARQASITKELMEIIGGAEAISA